MNSIAKLQPGDTIQIIAPAKAIEKKYIECAKAYLENAGYIIKIGKHCLGNFNYYSGTDQERTQDFQEAIDNEEVKAILCARGGYGSVRILDRIQWANQLRFPKWIIGFSDITVFHQQLQKFEQKSIHATMPLNFDTNSDEALKTLLYALEGKPYKISASVNKFNKNGTIEGELIGGNLSIIYSLIGTDCQPSYKEKILFIEEVGEQLYALDRMLYSLKKSGILDQISGLIVGGMTDIKDTTLVTIGMNIEEIIIQHFEYRKIPICFDFPAGHIDDNRALIFGETAKLEVTSKMTTLTFNNR